MSSPREGFNFRDGRAFGVGDEKIVYEDPSNPERVVSFRKEGTVERELSPGEVKARFYLTKIMHLLFPEHIPDISVSASSPDFIKRKKIKFDSGHDAIRRVRLLREEGKEPSEELAQTARLAREKIKSDEACIQFIERMEILGVDVDQAAQNFGYDTTGHVIYVEEFNALRMTAGGPRPWFDGDKIERAIENLDDNNRGSAGIYLERLKQVIAEEIGKIESNKKTHV